MYKFVFYSMRHFMRLYRSNFYSLSLSRASVALIYPIMIRVFRYHSCIQIATIYPIQICIHVRSILMSLVSRKDYVLSLNTYLYLENPNRVDVSFISKKGHGIHPERE